MLSVKSVVSLKMIRLPLQQLAAADGSGEFPLLGRRAEVIGELQGHIHARENKRLGGSGQLLMLF